MSLTRKRVRDLAGGGLSFRRIEYTMLCEALEAALRVVEAGTELAEYSEQLVAAPHEAYTHEAHLQRLTALAFLGEFNNFRAAYPDLLEGDSVQPKPNQA